MTTYQHEIIVIGGGPAGVTAALRARALGAQVALIERGRMGGTCTNDGCVPTRVLAKAARLLRDAEQFADYGLDAALPTLDFARLLARTGEIVYEIHEKKQLIDHLHEVGVALYEGVGDARFTDPHTVALGDGRTLTGEKFILCVGGHPRKLPIEGSEHTLTHSDIWTLSALPASVVVVGGGATGCQIASVMQAFGSQTTLMDIMPRLLPPEDEAVAALIGDEFRARGMTVITGIGGIERVEPLDARTLRLTYSKDDAPHTLDAEAVVLSVGWPGNLEALNLEAAGVRTVKGGYIEVNDALQTSVPHIYCAGDVNGRLMLVQTATYQARVAAENAVQGGDRRDNKALVPHGGFTDPEYGSVGMTEHEAHEAHGDQLVVATVPYHELDRAVIDGHPVGFCKLIAHRETRQILGVHVVGEQALEVVQMVAAGMASAITVERLAELQVAYPTFAGIVVLAARQIVRDLRLVEVAPFWHTLKRSDARTDWERSVSS